MGKPRLREGFFPDFLLLKVSLDTNDLQAFVYDFLTNQKETTFEALTKANQKLYRSRYNKQKKSIATFILFVEDIPENIRS